MELKPGYKQTEVGVIPQDWAVMQLGQVTDKVGSGITPTGGSRVYKDSGRPFIRSQNVGWGNLNLSDVAFIDDATHATFEATQIRGGDVFLNITGASIGRSAMADSRIEGGNVNQHVCIIRADQGKLAPDFLCSFLISSRGQRQIDSFQAGGNRQGLNFGQVRSIRIAIPETTGEQRVIVTALSDVDALLDGLDRLIAKKRDLKQAAIQQLLTGKTRLPGFEGEWEVKLLGDLLTYERPDRYIVTSTSYSSQGDIPVLTANKAFILGYTTETSGICTDLPAIVFDDFTTDNKFAMVPFKVKSSAIKILRPRNDRTNLRFLFEQMQMIRFPVGEHKRHYISDYQNIKLPIPEYDEQFAVISILSDMDAEISALEQRRNKAKDIKQAMMQDLLTGKTRLVTPGGFNA